MRYSVVGERNPNQLERAYGRLCRKINQNPNTIDEALIEELSPHVPLDAEFERSFMEAYVAEDTNNWRQVLIVLNAMMGTGETRIEGPTKVHVEHVLPRNPSQAALEEVNLTIEAASEFSGKVGNLTLLSGRKNREASNGPFSEKRPILAQSEIAMTITLAKHDSWGAEEIISRTQELARLAMQAWPWPPA